MKEKSVAKTKSDRGKAKGNKDSAHNLKRTPAKRAQPLVPEQSVNITDRKQAEAALRESEEDYRLFQGILQSSSDGILAVNRENEVLFANERFVEMWMIPQEVMDSKDDTLLLQYVLDQLSDPQGFLQKVQELYNSAEESFDTLYFKDGRVFERLSRPLMQEAELRGRVWSFSDITARKQAETLREVLLEIMQGGVTTNELQDFLSLVHRSIAKVIYAENFFILLYNKDAAWFEEIYSVDKFDPPGPPTWHEKSISAYIFRTGRPLLLNDEQVFSELVSQGEVELVGTNSPSWMGVPLKTSKETIGVMVVQDYDVPNRYSERDLELFASIAGQVALVVERRRVEEALTVSEAELRALFAGMTDVVIVYDVDGRYVKIAPTHPANLYRPAEEMLGKTLHEILPKEQADHIVGKVRESIQSGHVVTGEYTLQIDGKEIWRSASFSPLSETTAILVAHDITLYKQAEMELQRAEQRYRGLFEDAPAMYVITRNVEGSPVIMDCNELFSRTLGYSRDELVGKPVADVYSPASRVQLIEGGYRRALAGKFETEERELLARDGRIIPTLVSAVPERDVTGGIFGTRATFVDITERRQAEDELHNLKNELETTNLELQQALEREKRLACTDGMTGLCNHRYFFELAAREFHAAVRHRHPLAFLMFDMDDFKKVNDTLGHAAGDKLLVRVAQTAVAQVRASDVVARYGGDEFIVMLPYASAQQALHVAERIRAGVATLRVETDKDPFAIMVSNGIAEIRHEPVDENVERIIQRADEALYKAKQSGRNRTVIFGQDETGIN